VQIDWFTFVAQIVNFLILIALLQRFLYKPVIKAMDDREQIISSELEEARQKKVDAEQKEHQLDKRLKEFEEEKNQLLEEARQDVSKQRKEWIDQLRNETSEIRQRWISAVQSEQKTFLTHLKEETGEQVITLIKKVLGDLSERNLQQQTADFLLEKLSRLSEDSQQQLRQTIEQLDTTEAKIVSSFELEGQKKHQLAELLRTITGQELECNFEITQKLGFGIEVRIGGWRLGWNLESYLRRLREQMDQFLRSEIPQRQSTNIT